MKEINILLKVRCVELGISAKMLAREMELSECQLNRKINKRKIGNAYQTLTFCEKYYIAQRLKMDIKDIE